MAARTDVFIGNCDIAIGKDDKCMRYTDMKDNDEGWRMDEEYLLMWSDLKSLAGTISVPSGVLHCLLKRMIAPRLRYGTLPSFAFCFVISLSDIFEGILEKGKNQWTMHIDDTSPKTSHVENSGVYSCIYAWITMSHKGFEHPQADMWTFNSIGSVLRVEFLDYLVLEMCQIDQDRLHEQRSAECAGFGEAISNIALELKPES
ncbi:uncharacterized protein ARMOST_03208 [Armillaria ostoyae]|uniref:Uncharacterized protein n=1 Tax=Armillaria ostoyae TaxID=47428 RepID=A0A284QTX0_ARMOS|nr:uncharacterized protein ARMOST_03208 [Armillaria ostoyae]